MQFFSRFATTALVSLVAPAVFLTSCSSSKHEPTGSAQAGGGSSRASASTGKASDSSGRVENRKLGISYVLPKGFKEATGGREVPEIITTVFVLGEPDPTTLVTQFMLTKMQSSYDYAPGTSADMDNAALLDAFVKEAGTGPGPKVEGEPAHAQWQGALPGASALVKLKSETGRETGSYEAFLGSGTTRWSVIGTLTTLPPGGSLDSLKDQLDEFAKSIRPL